MTAPAPADNRPVLLVQRALGLGDLLTAIPALHALADAFPQHHRVLAGPREAGALAVAAGVVDTVVPARPLKPLPALPPVDVAVNLHGRGPQSTHLLRRVRPGRLVAFRCAGVTGPAWRAEEHEVHRWCRLLSESGIAADPARVGLDPAVLPTSSEPAGATVIHPGAASPARRWPPERWAVVARAEADAGRRVLVTGGPDEVALARRVAGRARLGPDAMRAGSTDVLELAALVAHAGRVVCSDTGVAHLATALQRPSVVLFGPVSPALWGPPPDDPRHIALWTGRSGDPHGRRPDPGLLEIGVADVVAAVRRLPDVAAVETGPGSAGREAQPT